MAADEQPGVKTELRMNGGTNNAKIIANPPLVGDTNVEYKYLYERNHHV